MCKLSKNLSSSEKSNKNLKPHTIKIAQNIFIHSTNVNRYANKNILNKYDKDSVVLAGNPSKEEYKMLISKYQNQINFWLGIFKSDINNQNLYKNKMLKGEL